MIRRVATVAFEGIEAPFPTSYVMNRTPGADAPEPAEATTDADAR